MQSVAAAAARGGANGGGANGGSVSVRSGVCCSVSGRAGVSCAVGGCGVCVSGWSAATVTSRDLLTLGGAELHGIPATNASVQVAATVLIGGGRGFTRGSAVVKKQGCAARCFRSASRSCRTVTSMTGSSASPIDSTILESSSTSSVAVGGGANGGTGRV